MSAWRFVCLACCKGDTKEIVGAKIVGVRRFGKGLVIDLSNNFLLAIHIKLTGQLVYADTKHKEAAKVKVIRGTYRELPNKWTHVIFHLDKNAKLYYNDFRQFGWIKIIQSAKLKDQSFFRDLGPEFPVVKVSRESPHFATSDAASRDKQVPQVSRGESVLRFEEFADILKKSKTVIKPLLMDQKKMSGIGNIYVNDGLNLAKIDPRRKASSLSDQEIKTLFTSLERVLKKGLETGGASELSFVNALGEEGGYQKYFIAYGREGQPCKNCGTPLKKIKLAGRGTYFCPVCQK